LSIYIIIYEKKTILAIAVLWQLTAACQKNSFKWIGGPTYVLEIGKFKIVSDPMLSPKSDSAFFIKKHPSTGLANASIK
jgi:N-acyl-phosphatidylethanolamine-hydrolysing phospholipase D